jgi:NitT/TauT family transport system permease protein
MTWNDRIRDAAGPIAMAILFFVLWELACVLFKIPNFILPKPSETIVEIFREWSVIWPNARQTLFTTVVGFAAAIVFGLFLGGLVGISPALYRSLSPLLVAFNSVPKVAVVPILVLWFGIGTVPAVLTAFLIAFFPIAVNVAAGIAALEPELADVLRSLGANRREILMKVGIPRSLPYFFASLKVAITLAFVGSVISETVAANEGIGYLMLAASSSFRITLVFAALLVVAVMGVLMYAAAAWTEGFFTHWAVRDEGAATNYATGG